MLFSTASRAILREAAPAPASGRLAKKSFISCSLNSVANLNKECKWIFGKISHELIHVQLKHTNDSVWFHVHVSWPKARIRLRVSIKKNYYSLTYFYDPINKSFSIRTYYTYAFAPFFIIFDLNWVWIPGSDCRHYLSEESIIEGEPFDQIVPFITNKVPDNWLTDSAKKWNVKKSRERERYRVHLRLRQAFLIWRFDFRLKSIFNTAPAVSKKCFKNGRKRSKNNHLLAYQGSV